MFTIPFSPEELWGAYRNWHDGGNKSAIRMNGADALPNPQGIFLIAPMLVHLGAFPKTPTKDVNPNDHDLLKKKFDPPVHYYRCKHFDSKERICTIYEHRPVMCREYPNGRPCNYASCTWEEKRAKKQTPKERRDRLRVLQEMEARAKDPGGAEIEEPKAPDPQPIDINETINIVALVDQLNDKRRDELATQLEVVQTTADLMRKAKKQRGRKRAQP